MNATLLLSHIATITLLLVLVINIYPYGLVYATTIAKRTEFLGFKESLHTIIIIRISFDDLKRGVESELSTFQNSSVAKRIAPLQVITDIMYRAADLSNNVTIIYKWNQSLPRTSIAFYDRGIPAWSVINGGNSICPTNTNYNSNWYTLADSFLNIQGPISGNIVGFILNAAQGGNPMHNSTFNRQYINADVFNKTDYIAYIVGTYIWSRHFAWLYAYVMPTKNGDLEIHALFRGDSKSLSLAASMYNVNYATYNSTTITSSDKFWQMMPFIKGTNPPDNEKWCRYIRVGNYTNSTYLWKGSGFTLQNGNSEKFIELRLSAAHNDRANNKNTNTTFNYKSSIMNATSQSQNSISNKSCSRLPGQYDVTLSDSIMQNPNAIKSVLDDLTQKVVRSGVKVTNVLESIGIFGIKSMNQQLLNKVIDDLRHDPRIASVQPTVCVGIDSLGP
jgi:hypothetical protein